MKGKLGPLDLVTLALVVGTGAVTVALYSRLPARVPIHFDMRGVVNGWMNRLPGVLFLPLVALGLWGLLRLGVRLLPAEWRARMDRSPIAAVCAVLVALFCSLQFVVLYAAIDAHRSTGTLLGLLLGAFWFGVGLVVPRVRRNPWVGVRTPWTLTSDENWARTHRVAGQAFTIAGALGILGTMVTRSAAPSTMLITASALVPAVYSFLLARRSPPPT